MTRAAMLRPKTQPMTVDSGKGAITASHECALSILTTFAACSDAIQDSRNEHGRDHDQHECGLVESDCSQRVRPSRARQEPLDLVDQHGEGRGLLLVAGVPGYRHGQTDLAGDLLHEGDSAS